MPANCKIAVLMTCHNRRSLTLACLETLRDQALFDPRDLFLVDDGSGDGTGAAVQAMMPEAQVIAGSGNLFWNGGMRLAWERALQSGRGHDFYLWLNDDVVLEPGVLAAMVVDADSTVARGGAIIVAAATRDGDTGEMTYSGQSRTTPGRPLRLKLDEPRGTPQRVDTVSGNIVLVSAAAERVLGNLDPAYVHIFGDLDYGFRAGAAGIPVVVASGYGGICAANTITGSSLDPGMTRLQRLRRRWKEAGGLHARDWRTFVLRHGGGALAVLGHRLAPYVRIVLDRTGPEAASSPRSGSTGSMAK